MADPITLLAPRAGAVTPPLQLCSWADYRSEYENGSYPAVNRGLGLGVRLVWESRPGEFMGNRRYDLRLSTTPDFTLARVWTDLRQNFFDLQGLELGRRYYWKVVERRRGKLSGESPVGWFDTHPQPPRWLSAQGIANLRDVGGWAAGPGKRVRQGLVYRSVELNNHVRLPAAGRRYLLDELGIRTDLDLRGEPEKPSPALDKRRVAYINAPVDAYATIGLDWSREGYRLAFETLARADAYPVLVHCWGGADRTGSLVFMLNGLLGVDLADLAHDYELTSLSGVGKRLASSLEFQGLLAALASYAAPGAPLQKQIEGFLDSAGVTPDQVAALRRNLVET